MIYVPPLDYYKVTHKCKTLKIVTFHPDNDISRMHAYNSAVETAEHVSKNEGGVRVTRWDNGALYTVWPYIAPPRALGTGIAPRRYRGRSVA